jgi:hypothetical protein
VIATQLASGQEVRLFENFTTHAQGWTEYITDGIIVENTTVRLSCKHNQTSAIVNYLRASFDSDGGSVSTNFQTSPSFGGDLRQPDGTVLIEKFSKRYEGLWDCTAQYNAPDRFVTLTGVIRSIYLAVAPRVSVFIAPNVNLSDSVTITCGSPEAIPIPTYMAIFRGSTLLNNVTYQVNVNHTITNAKLSDATEYRCEGENKAGKGSRTKKLIVQYVPTTTIVNGSGPIQVNQAENVTLVCESVGVPLPVITWLRNGSLVQSNNGALEIISADKEDTTSYTCVGRNDAGVHTDTIELQVRVPPDPPHNLRAETKTNVSVTLSWMPGSDNFSPITGYKVNYRRNGTNDQWLVARNFSDSKATALSQLVGGLMPLTSYEFKVRARNNIGRGEYSEIAILTTHPNAPSVGPTNLTVKHTFAESADLTWTLANNSLLAANEGTIIYYEMEYVTGGKSESQNTLNVTSEGTLTGLKKGTSYDVKVYARNSGIYRSPPSDTRTIVTSTTVPGVVGDLKVTRNTEYSLSISWEEPTDNGGTEITKYFIRYYQDGSPETAREASKEPSDHSFVLENLTPSTRYRISVRALNSRGNGTWKSIVDDTSDRGKNSVIMQVKGGPLV